MIEKTFIHYLPYKFVIAFENEQISGYVTEKLVNPMLAGAIPIYLGDNMLDDTQFNLNSFINVANYNSFEDCIDYILEVDSNDQLYQKYLDEPWLKNNKIDKEYFSIYYGGSFYSQLKNNLPKHLADKLQAKDVVSEKILMVTFSDGKKYTFDKILKEAQNSGFFNECKAYLPTDLSLEFKYKHNDYMLNNERGFGYYIWKPEVIRDALLQLEMNDILVWVDSGNSLIKTSGNRMAEYYKMLKNDDNSDNISFQIRYRERDWCKRDLLNAIKRNYNLVGLDDGQLAAGFFILKKTLKTIKMVNEWLKYCQDYNLIDFSIGSREDKDFKENRGEQSIFSLLRKIYGTIILNDLYSDSNNINDYHDVPVVCTRIK